MKKINTIIATIVIICITSCKKWVEVAPPTTSLTSQTTYSSNSTASAAVTGIYSKLADGSLGTLQGNRSFGMLAGLSADEFTLFLQAGSQTPLLGATYMNTLQSSVNLVPSTWSDFYKIAYYANDAINALNNSSGITESLKSQLLGECKFLRAYSYFYLVNAYGPVPLIIGPDSKQNSVASRASIDQVYQQIFSDLKDASGLLSTDFVDPTGASTTERIRPNKWAAYGLLARAYLYYGNLTNSQSNFVHADSLATAVINNSGLFSLVSLNNVFLKNSNEAIWQLQEITPNLDTYDANVYILTSGPNSSKDPVYLSPQLLAAFEPNDQRSVNWIGVDNFNGVNYYYPYKYKIKGGSTGTPISEYLMMLRLAEQYLIRAEAKLNEGDLSGAAVDINFIRNRAGLPNTTATTKSDLLSAILHERQTELFTEWGHRWFDLKRSGTVDGVMTVVTPQKGGNWNINKQLFPLPLSDIQADPNLTQNPGY